MRVVAETVVLAISGTTCLGADEDLVLLTTRAMGGEVVLSMFAGVRKSFYCGINAMEIVDGKGAGMHPAVLTLLPGKENTEVAFKLQFHDTAPGLPSCL